MQTIGGWRDTIYAIASAVLSQSSETAPMDPLSDVLSLLKPRSYASGGFDVGGAMAIQFPAHLGIKCYAVSHGAGWLEVEGTGGPVRLTAGDCFLLPRGRPFRLAHSGEPVSVIALALGYESESAFSTAFKRVMGSSPRRYGRGRAEAAASHAPVEMELEAVA